MSLWKTAEELQLKARDFVIVTLLDIKGSAPQNIGAKMLVSSEGLEFGTIGGGKVELHALGVSKKILETNVLQNPSIVTWNLQKDIGMSCGGEVKILFEHYTKPSWKIVIFGAGHIAQALTRTLAPLNCHITCVDSRKEWLDKFDLERVKIHCIQEPHTFVKSFDPNSYFLSMTMGHAFDLPILEAIAKTHPHCPYVGVIGSEVKGNKIKTELKNLGIDQHFLEKLKVPMGLSIGSNDPWEIAISITAELLLIRDANNKS